MTEYNTLLKVEVTAEDIKEGKRKSCTSCPIALAFRRALGHDEVKVGEIYTKIGKREYRTPKVAFQFITLFDKYQKVEPFTFYMQLVD